MLALVRAPIRRGGDHQELILARQEVVKMEEIRQTTQLEKPPPPPRPPVPVEVSNDEVIEDLDLDLDAALDIDEPISNLPPAPSAAEADEQEPEIFVVVEQMPDLIGGFAALQQRLRYPDMAKKAGVSGRVIIQFIVDEKGQVTAPVVLRGIGGGCDEEALRVVSGARFTPGMQRNHPVKVRMTLPVTFKLR